EGGCFGSPRGPRCTPGNGARGRRNRGRGRARLAQDPRRGGRSHVPDRPCVRAPRLPRVLLRRAGGAVRTCEAGPARAARRLRRPGEATARSARPRPAERLRLSPRRDPRQILATYGTALVAAVLFAIFAVAAPNFLNGTNLLNVLKQISVLAILGLG